ncbi:hypothetical protein l11_20700 [Neisseria weaveri LMG 5135]|nr:hypothetical protein l11_20700 [Neisseria weaveri LMG 5135]EGV35945.1 hypothetical protein l13_12850 [Neisseria weaveri ATCC 51223]
MRYGKSSSSVRRVLRGRLKILPFKVWVKNTEQPLANVC